MKKILLPALSILLLGVTAASIYYFTVEGNIEVRESQIELSQQSFSAEICGGARYVKNLKIKNYGDEKSVYFDFVVEGPDPKAVDVSVHDIYGNSISSSNRLVIPAGSENSPAEVEINIHISMDDDAKPGEYTVYVVAKET
ncbi:hypothetical protein [Geoglobus acetivorans]|uniref:Uncharacterized protein n=1 Tax=Geoglobus acetivorans TaxID=565033 RepID=A0ABZ3H6V6_GEOAI|nr:hypothetical protein [Geoglobus acetivorans]